jgi:hypothetical protein
MNEKYLVTPQTSAQIQQQAVMQDPGRELQEARARSYAVAAPVGFIAYIAMSILYLVAVNIKTIAKVLSGSTSVDSAALAQQIGSQLMVYGDLQIVNWITIVLFWGTVGLGVYTLFWLGMAFFTTARNGLIVETAFSNRGHFQDRIRVPLIKLLLLAGMIITLILTIKWLGPFWANLFARGVYSLSSQVIIGAVEMLAAVVGTFLNIYVVRSLIVYFRHADAIF